SLWGMNAQLPQRAAGRLLAAHQPGAGPPVPMEFSGELFFPGGASAAFFCSYRAGNQQWATVSGTHGSVHVPDFVVPFYGNEASFEADAPVLRVRSCCDFGMESQPRRLAVHESSNGSPDAQETNMIRTFAQMVTSGGRQPRWGDQALATQQVLDALLCSARQDGSAVAVGGEPAGSVLGACRPPRSWRGFAILGPLLNQTPPGPSKRRGPNPVDVAAALYVFKRTYAGVADVCRTNGT